MTNAKKAETLFSVFPKLTFARGQTIVSPGEKSRFIFFLKSGIVKQFSDGKASELVIHQYRPGSFFHLQWLISPEPNHYHFKAITAATVFRVPTVKVKQMLRENPELLWQTTQRLIAGVNGLAKRLEIITGSSAGARVESLLAYLTKKYGNPIPFKLTHQDIAAWIGTTRETVSLEMAKLTKAGKIAKTRGLIEIK